ncbi:hypothetical protein [Ensifer canadensis]
MSFELIGFVTVLVGLGVLMAPIRWALTFMVVSTAFGSAAAINLPALGGASILVPNVFLLFFGLRVLMAYGEGPVLAAFAPAGSGFWLTVLTLFGVLTAILSPRLFQGAVDVMTVERSVGARSFISLSPLRFSSNNITQAVYALGGLACFGFCHAYLRRTAAPSHLVHAILIAATVNLAFAAADILTYFSGTEYLLSVVRTANYALLTAAEKGGLKRISGSFPEASAFADYTLILFAATASLWLDRVRSRATALLASASLAGLVFSTSATALLGLAVIFPFLWIRSIVTVFERRKPGRPVFLAALFLVVPLVMLAIINMFPEMVSTVYDFLDEMLLSKVDSQSGRERSMWNTAAYEAFVNTSGMGAGLGSARASSYLLVLLSNVGVLGLVIFCIFVATILYARVAPGAERRAESPAALRSAKAGFIAALSTALVSGTVYDLGLMFYILGGSVSALTCRQIAEAEAPRPRLVGATSPHRMGGSR